MPEAKDALVRAGNQLMDAAEWGSARELYRRAFLHALPDNGAWVSNLRSAETYDRVQFWESLRAKYPDSPQVLQQLLVVLTEARQQSHLVHLCTQLLQGDGSRPMSRWKVHWWRMYAALGILAKAYPGPYQSLAEDFNLLWGMERLRAELLKGIASLSDSQAIPELAALATQDAIPAQVRRFLELKIQELRLLADLRAADKAKPTDLNGA